MLTRTPTRKKLLVSFAAPALVAFGMLAAAPGWAQSNDPAPAKPGAEEHHRAMEAHRAEMMQHHLDAAAERLELKASQVPAWQQFGAAFTALHQPPAMAHGHEHEAFDKRDAAAWAKLASEHAADRAKKLATLADATAKLQATMTDNQRALFTQMAREHLMHHHRPHPGMPGRHTPWHPGGDEHGPGMHGEADGFGPPPMAMEDGGEFDGPPLLALEDDDE